MSVYTGRPVIGCVEFKPFDRVPQNNFANEREQHSIQNSKRRFAKITRQEIPERV